MPTVSTNIDSLFTAFRQKAINNEQLSRLLFEINWEEVPLKNMSFIRILAEEARYHAENKTSTIEFQKLLSRMRAEYLLHLDLKGQTLDELSFTGFIEEIIDTYATPKREYNSINEKDDFWNLVKKIEENI